MKYLNLAQFLVLIISRMRSDLDYYDPKAFAFTKLLKVCGKLHLELRRCAVMRISCAYRFINYPLDNQNINID